MLIQPLPKYCNKCCSKSASDNAVNVTKITPITNANSTLAVLNEEVAKSNFRWSFFEDDALIDVLVEEIGECGKHYDNGWMPGALRRVAMKLRLILSYLTIDKGNVNNRLRTLKEKYVLAKEASSQSGFSMIPDGRITGDDIAWEAYVQGRSLRHSGIRHYDKLGIIFGTDHTHGNLSYEPNDELPLGNLHLDFVTLGYTNDAPEYMHVDPDIPTSPTQNENPPVGGGGTFGDGGQPSGIRAKPRIGQKRCRSLFGYDKFDDSILIMDEVAKEMASSFDKAVMPRLLLALKGIPKLSHGNIRCAMIVFGRDRESAEILVSMNESMHYDFVRDMIGYITFSFSHTYT